MAKILKCDDAIDIESVDESVGNKWRWQWVEKTVDMDLSKYPKITKSDTIIICLKDSIRKIDQCGKAICLLYRRVDTMKYATNGVATLTKHVQSFGLLQKEVAKLTSYKIFGSGVAKNVEEIYEPLPCFPIHLHLNIINSNSNTSTNRSHRRSCLRYGSNGLCLSC